MIYLITIIAIVIAIYLKLLLEAEQDSKKHLYELIRASRNRCQVEWEKKKKAEYTVLSQSKKIKKLEKEKDDYRDLAMRRQEQSRERNRLLLLDQLYRLEGVLGEYNCQNGGTKCRFQTNCHRLIRKEIDILEKPDTVHFVNVTSRGSLGGGLKPPKRLKNNKTPLSPLEFNQIQQDKRNIPVIKEIIYPHNQDKNHGCYQVKRKTKTEPKIWYKEEPSDKWKKFNPDNKKHRDLKMTHVKIDEVVSEKDLIQVKRKK